ncbi:hypothetical protein [Hominenteromicrobium sp.]|jgi:hypothetical protein|uniref:hypothetical protein n=1 Tax=Hominenteromicrobium sp. TaxID=3073581 RepID=UPI00206606A5|nr:MAG TPA: hypothetical protein [Caudoviricetes sp.]
MSEQEKREKMLKIEDLYASVFGIPELKFFDLNSEELLDEKIEVLTQLKKGKQIGDIPDFYKVLEKMPKEGIWDL